MALFILNIMKHMTLPAPDNIPFLLRPVLWASEKITGKRMEISRILSWSFPVALAAGILESGVERAARKKLSKRTAKLIRMQVSLRTGCPFCIDMNGFAFRESGITGDEALALQNGMWKDCSGFSAAEKILLDWVNQMSLTPIAVKGETLDALQKFYSPREITVMGALAGKVNLWARILQAYQVQPAGFGGLRDLEIHNF